MKKKGWTIDFFKNLLAGSVSLSLKRSIVTSNSKRAVRNEREVDKTDFGYRFRSENSINP